jgi:small redox-active disulfide protein 2
LRIFLTDELKYANDLKDMNIKILGTGCPKCRTLEKLTREVVEQNGIDATITKVEDIVEIMKYGVMTTPALVVDEKVTIKGRIPSTDEIKRVLTQ